MWTGVVMLMLVILGTLVNEGRGAGYGGAAREDAAGLVLHISMEQWLLKRILEL